MFIVDCGEGRCVNSNNASLLGFDCVCNPGWKKIQIGNLPFSACLIPNCTINFDCSDVSTPPPLPTSLPPPSPCNVAWCGDGTCADNGTGHTCQCFPGSSNLLDNSSLPCLQQCSLGEDCKELALVLPLILPPPLPFPPPPPTKSTTVGK
ncbi:hypothetical protein Q3G72_007751 [Acer saccharum]|nr:hypothetical protein Q3G72_007751 [Acer saccharum]